MKSILGLTLAMVLSLSIVGCKKKEAVPKNVASSNQYENRQFGHVRQNDDNVEDVVVCRNCRAKFKLKRKWRKLAMKGGTEIMCPVCHHNYLQKVSH